MPGRHCCVAASPDYYSGKLGFDMLRDHFPDARVLVDGLAKFAMPNGYNVVSMKNARFHTHKTVAARVLAMQFRNTPESA